MYLEAKDSNKGLEHTRGEMSFVVMLGPQKKMQLSITEQDTEAEEILQW